jgi:predicted nucleic acid-binding protein
MIHLDTSALVAALTGDRPAATRLRALIDRGSRLGVSTLVLYEWWRGPRVKQELAYQELLFPRDAAFAFGPAQAALAADIYRRLDRPRQRSVDIAIAACAMAQGASLWTLNPNDFKDIPDLELA